MTLNSPDTGSLDYRRRSTQSIMLHVMLALVPGTLLYAVIINPLILRNLLLAIVSAMAFEALLLLLRKRRIFVTLKDCSIVLAAWLFTLCVPAELPTWQLIVGTFIMTALGKHVFGGLGHNPFNPAMVAYAVLLVSFPVSMTQWQEPVEQVQLSPTSEWDGVTSATPLDQIRHLKNTSTESDTSKVSNSTLSTLVMSSHWLWINVCWLLGGLYLLARRIISWHIPISVLGTLTIMYLLAGSTSDQLILPVFPALLSGAILLGAFFIATDPVSAATSKQGKLIYGIGIGMLCYFLREYSAYPEGFAFAVLLMNSCVPLIDYLFKRA